ncbi:MAG TPA: glycoside hydrolase domain-containing protein [Armatimonadota bacterium]|nr:glycoside hydrolase domain-containing protein [Armatimonadota bacterium]
MRYCYFCIVLVLLFARSAAAAQYRAPLMAKAPVIDGRIEPGEWSGAIRIDGFAWQGVLERRRATGYVGADAAHLYLAIRSQLPAHGNLLTSVKRDGANVVYDDAVEFWVDPDLGHPRGHQYQLLLNSTGARFYQAHPFGGLPEDPSWQGNWKVASQLHDGWWDCEVSIPVATVASGRAITDGAWGINLCRDWKQDWAWSSTGGKDYAPSDRFSFTTTPAPVPGVELRGDPFTGRLNPALSLTNPSTTPLTVAANLSLSRDVMPTLARQESVTIPPGETREIALQATDAATRRYSLTARAAAPDGTVYFDRTVSWSAGPPWEWTTKIQVVHPVDFQFAYYPYQNRMRVRVDASKLPSSAVLASLTAVIRKTRGAVIKTVKFDRLKDGKEALEFSLPPLNGDYEIGLKAHGKGVPTGEIVKPFERHVFPWEHNNLGKSTRVYPPFTPIRVTGRRVSTVLRDHTMNNAGLWDQVVARGVPLLAAPMRWEAAVDGKRVVVKSSPLHWEHVAGDSARALAQISARQIGAKVVSTWDYDGTMRVDLTLTPHPKRRIDSLTLVIPMRGSQAAYYHAMGDGIRNTLYGRVPAGKGVVWTAKEVQSSDLPKNFCTYLYVGTPVRGLCWFAENDSGWSWDPSTPNMELRRTAGGVDIVVHLVNRPVILNGPRTITFGLLAAPVKPRIPPDWRQKYRRDHYSLLGTDINWLGLGDAASLYPAGKDLYLWQMIARGNREHLSDADIQKVIDSGRPYFAPYGPEIEKTFENHVRYNLTARYGTKMIFYYNRASYQAADEFQTFQDEWDLSDYRTVGPGKSRSEIKIVPSESYIDQALYWYGKSFDIGHNQGVYWDNWFFIGDYNTAMTGAYQGPGGSVVPSTGIWGLRELAKRTFQYMNERGMPPVTMAHMTSTAILPLLSFCTLQYDWEWKYSEGDVQDRFSRPYILMVSDGELAGTWPVLLNDHGKLEDDPWTGRTFAAVAMLHELDCPYPSYTRTGRLQIAMFKPVDEILAQPGVRAYRYWDDRPQPVHTDNPDLPTIVYSVKGKEAVFAVVSYVAADSTANVAIDPRMLGFAPGYRVTDTETGQPIPVNGDHVVFPLKRHDIRICRIVPG